MKLRLITLIAAACLAAMVFFAACSGPGKPQSGSVLDEARQANRPASSFTAADEDYFSSEISDSQRARTDYLCRSGAGYIDTRKSRKVSR